jgi:hypothetical protein
MICPNCAREIVPQPACPHCQWAIPTPSESAPIGDAFLPAKSKTAWARLKTPFSVVATVLAWLLSAACWYVIAITSLLVTVRKYGSLSAEAYGYLIGSFIGTFLLPLLGVTLYYRKRLPRVPVHRKVLVISVLSLLLSVFVFQGNHSLPVNLTSDRASRLAQEGAGLVPASPDQSIWDASVRSFFAEVKEHNRQYVAEAGALDQSALTGMYSAESFRDRARMEKIMAQLRANLAVDEKYSSIEPLIERMESRVRAVDAPKSAKEQFLEGFTSGTRKKLSERTEIIAREKAWVQASIDLYEFTFAKKPSYFLRGEKLVFRDDGLASEFDLRIKKAETLRTDFLQAKENFDNSQKEGLAKLKLKPSDVGNPPETPLATKPK